MSRRSKSSARRTVIFGSGVLVRSLMRRELIDEFVLQIHPTILGRGRRLFEDGVPRTKLSLVKSQATATGVVIATYECAGAGTSV